MKRSMRLMVGRLRRRADLDERAREVVDPGHELTLLDCWDMGPCTIIRQHHQQFGWHFSISHPSRYPSWDEIAEARYQLVPDEVTVGILLPSSDQYVNLHRNCFHVHEVADPERPSALLLGASGEVAEVNR